MKGKKIIIGLFSSFLLVSCFSKKELFSYAYHFNLMEIELIDINKRDGYYLIKGICEGDTVALISKNTEALVRVNKGGRKWKELQIKESYEFDLLAIYEPRDFGDIILSKEIDSLTKDGYLLKNRMGPKYYRVLGRYGYEE